MSVTKTERGRKLAAVNLKFRNFILYENLLKTPEGVHPMSPEVRASVEDRTGKSFAPVKMLALGVFGMRKKTGSLYLTLEGPGFFLEREAPAGIAASQARKFAAKVNNRARQLTSADQT